MCWQGLAASLIAPPATEQRGHSIMIWTSLQIDRGVTYRRTRTHTGSQQAPVKGDRSLQAVVRDAKAIAQFPEHPIRHQP